MTDTIIDPLRTQAASDLTWAEGRAKTYQDDGAPVPEPIRRLKMLADLALTHTPKPAGGVTSNEVQEAQMKVIRATLGARDGETTEAAAGRVVASAVELRARSVRFLRDAATVIGNAAGDLENSLKGDSWKSSLVDTRAGISVVSPERGSSSLGGKDVEVVIASNGPALVTTHEPGTHDRKREQIALSHGLVLMNLEQGHCAVITEPTEGRWFAQTILTDGKLSDPFAAHPGQWWTDKWEARTETIAGIMPHWKAAPALAKGQQATIPGSGPLPGATPPETTKKRAGDWTPSDTDIAGYSKSIGEALEKAGMKADSSPESISRLVAKFKVEKADAMLANVGVSFYHWAVKALKG